MCGHSGMNQWMVGVLRSEERHVCNGPVTEMLQSRLER
jgi:hypothetical protein